jgi:hypothetical protein
VGKTSEQVGYFYGPVYCSIGGGNTAQPSFSSSLTGTSQDKYSKDGDGDGILDSSDRCTRNSNPRCIKEAQKSMGIGKCCFNSSKKKV